MSHKKSTMDLTEGSIVPLIIRFALPILLSQLFQNLYNSVDSVIVGNFVGTSALAAVTSSGEISRMIVGFFTGLAAGSGVLFSRFFGAKDYKNLRASIHTALSFAFVLGVVMSTVSIVISPWLLNILACPADVFDEALTYLRVYLVGIFFTSVYNLGSGVLRAVGDSKDPLIYLIIASITNVILDLVFVAVFDMGIMGAAVATVLAQLLSALLVLNNMLRTKDVYKLSFRELGIDRKLLVQILNLGIPAAIQTCIISVSNLFVQRYINLQGSSVAAGYGAGKRIDHYVGLLSNSIGLAATTFISQNIGAKREDRAFRGLGVCLVMCLVSVAFLGPIIFYNSELVMRIFSKDSAVIAVGIDMIECLVPLYVFQIFHQLFGQAMRGFGKSKVTMSLTITGNVVIRQIYLAVFTAMYSGHKVIFFSYPVGWAASATLDLLYFSLFILRPYLRRKKAAEA